MAEATQTVRALARHVRISPQKARLVVDLIRGMKADKALQHLRFTQKRIAADVAKLLTSAIANATENNGLDADALYVVRAFVNEGPRQKRIRPAPMGRAYRYQRRSAHIEIHVGEKPLAGVAPEQPAEAAAAAPAKAKRPAPRKPAAKKPAARKPAKPAAKSSPAAKRAASPKKPKASTPQKRGGK